MDDSRYICSGVTLGACPWVGGRVLWWSLKALLFSFVIYTLHPIYRIRLCSAELSYYDRCGYG